LNKHFPKFWPAGSTRKGEGWYVTVREDGKERPIVHLRCFDEAHCQRLCANINQQITEHAVKRAEYHRAMLNRNREVAQVSKMEGAY
jgi:hypothetical protein